MDTETLHDVEVDLAEADGPELAPFVYDPMEGNLVKAFSSHPVGQEALKEIRDLVSSQFKTNWEATERYRKRLADNWSVFIGDLPPKDDRFKDLANGHLPIAMETISRLAFRVYGELFGDPWHTFDVVPVGPEDSEVANVLSTHGNWQFREQIRDFQRQSHRAVLGFFMFGDVTSHSWYDEHRGCNRHEVLTPDQFLTPYAHTTTQPDYSDLPWYAKIVNMYAHQLEAYRERWEGIDELLSDEAPDIDADPDQPISDSVAAAHELEPGDANKDTPYRIIWWEGWLELPNENRRRFCQVIWDYRTEAILSLIVQERWDWQDRIRYERQQNELTVYRAEQQMFAQAMMQYQMTVGAPAQVMGLEQMAMVPMEPPPPPQPPIPPDWMKDPTDPDEEPEKPVYRPCYMFAHAVCVEPFFGNLGYGYGQIEADINRAMNVLFCQFVDQASLANLGCWLAPAGLQFEGESSELQVAPGKVNYVSGVAPSDLPNALVPLKQQPANPQMVEAIRMLAQYAETAVQAPNIMSGAPGKSGETAREWAGRLEQATKQLSVMSDKLLQFFVQIFRNNAYLNSIYLKEEELIEVTNHLLQGEQIVVRRSMYERNYNVEIRADLKFTSRTQKVQEADEAAGLIFSNPFIQQMPTGPQLMYYAVKKQFEARGRRDLVQLLGPPPPPAPPAPPMPPPGAPPPGGPGGPGGPPPPQGPPPGGSQ